MDEKLPSLKDVIACYDLAPKKSLGQHFLLNPSVLEKIVTTAGDLSEYSVIEVGPGPGGLSRVICEKGCRHFYLIEKDDRAIEGLSLLEKHFKTPLTILAKDALEVSAHTLGDSPRKLISNLPYNVSVPLFLRWLEHIQDFDLLVLMFQKEVALRLKAKPSTPDYGRLSVITQLVADVELLFDLPPGAFSPPPKVVSSIIRVRPKKKPPTIDFNSFEKLTAAAFGQRRKMLRSSLKSLMKNPEELLEKAGIEPTSRAEELTPQDFFNFYQHWRLS
ncbi:16S rRNA (adenine(1518)-N(6)/adenine(1519)-N(6))-dimethyltransferase RsmA [Candidatus Bealeia paramacronuclearis]|uniref:Ribosomal RNA small subunit methyltransferase A n=1 Tax=Candidatus Bealeia paramacronuclearis TaxID=1921001 RepID=A0ABZ2C4N9_9PROT|nr:16S rRNA (adenine(1518)-N(6)/adenine(1519)-N(6))-dimethyltransferase RsmA [Candidatus Bealeia paramacronuclearis]